MSYSNPNRRNYSVPVNDVSGIKGPKGKAGTLICVHLAPTTTFTASTCKIGTVADDDAYASCVFGAAADTLAYSTDDGVTDTDAIILAAIPADTAILVTTANGGAGAGTMMVVIDWAD